MSVEGKIGPFVGGVAVGAATAFTLYAAARSAHEAGLSDLVQLAPFVDIAIDRAPLHEIREGEVRNIEALQDVVIVWGGDSQGLPSDKRATTPNGKFTPNQPGAIDDHIAAELNRRYPNLNVGHENYADPGKWSTELLEQLKDRNSALAQALLAPGRRFFGFSVGLNDWQDVVADPSLLKALTSLGEGGLTPGKIAAVIGSIPTFTRGHRRVGERLGGVIPEILQEVARINEERIALDRGPLVGVGVLCPADFGKAHAISLGQPGVEQTRKIVIAGNYILQRVGSAVSGHAAMHIEKGMQTKIPGIPLVFFTSRNVEFLRPTGQEQSEEEVPDQHLGQNVKQLGIDAANTLLAELAPLIEVEEFSTVT